MLVRMKVKGKVAGGGCGGECCLLARVSAGADGKRRHAELLRLPNVDAEKRWAQCSAKSLSGKNIPLNPNQLHIVKYPLAFYLLYKYVQTI